MHRCAPGWMTSHPPGISARSFPATSQHPSRQGPQSSSVRLPLHTSCLKRRSSSRASSSIHSSRKGHRWVQRVQWTNVAAAGAGRFPNSSTTFSGRENREPQSRCAMHLIVITSEITGLQQVFSPACSVNKLVVWCAAFLHQQARSISDNGSSQGQGLAHQGPLGFLGSLLSGFSGRQSGTAKVR